MQVRIDRILAAASFTFALLPIIGAAHGGTIDRNAEGFAALAGGKLSTAANVRIGGHVGGAGVWLGQDNAVDGDVLATGPAGAGRGTAITGRLSAGRSASLHREASVGRAVDSGGRVWFGRNARSGAVRAAGAVNLSREARVDGPISHGGSFWADRGARITGPVAPHSAEAELWDGARRRRPDFQAGGPNQWAPRGRPIDLTPGRYGALSVDREATLRLTAGEYDFSNLWLGREAELIADTSAGAVRINVAGELTVDREVVFDAPPGLLSVQAGRSIHIGRESEIEASLISFGDASIDRETTLGGQVYADRSLWLGRGVEVLGAPAAPGGGSSPIPEPASALLLGLGGLAMGRRRAGGRARADHTLADFA